MTTIFEDVFAGKFNLQPGDGIAIMGLGDLPHPATCMRCGSGNYDGGYLSLGVYFDYEGQMLLCLPCFEKYAQFLGFLSPEATELAKTRLNELVAENGTLKEELTNALGKLELFTSLIRESLSDSDERTPYLGIPSSKDGEGELQSLGEGEPEVSSSESKPSESTEVPGPAGISESAVSDVTEPPIRVRARGQSSGPAL